MRTTTLVLALVALGACRPWSLHPWGADFPGEPLWNAERLVPALDGLYVELPHAGRLVRVDRLGDMRSIDLEGRVLESLTPTPDASALVAFTTEAFCPEEDAPCEDLETRKELALVRDAALVNAVEVDPHFNAVAFSPSGQRAIAYLDVNAELSLEGVINLTAVAVLDLETAEVEDVQVGFAAEQVLFTPDDTRAVVLSRSEVAVLDLTTSPPSTDVVFPLTLDPDQTVEPVGIDLTPDGRYALISVRQSSDLYVLDLDLHAVNIVSLAANPSAMVVDDLVDRTVLVFDSEPRVDLLEHDFFEVDSRVLDEPMNRIVHGENLSVLYSQGTSYKDVYRLDIATGDLVEYRLENPAIELVLAPTEDYAVALTRAEGAGGVGVSGLYDSAPGMEILDLRPGADDTYPYLLESTGVGVAFASTETTLHALVLQEGVDYLYQLDLYTGEDEEIELAAPPRSIGTMPDGSFFIAQEGAFGRISFLDPSTGDLEVVEGFALDGWLDPEGVQ